MFNTMKWLYNLLDAVPKEDYKDVLMENIELRKSSEKNKRKINEVKKYCKEKAEKKNLRKTMQTIIDMIEF